MRNRYLIISAFLIYFSLFKVSSKGFEVVYFDKTNLIDENKIIKFIPNGYSILDSISGELNGDNYKDIVLILKKDGEDTIYDIASKRPILIIIGLPNQEYKIAVKNENIVYSHDMGGASKADPYDKIEIESRVLKIEHSGGMGRYRWTSINSFQYFTKEKKWYLIKMETNELVLNYHYDDTLATEETEITVDRDSTNIKTIKDFGKILLENFNIYK